MIEAEILRRALNAGSIIGIQDGGNHLMIVLEDDVELCIRHDGNNRFSVTTFETPMPEKKDDDLPVLTVSVTLWPGQDQKGWLKLLDTAVRRAQGVM